MAVAAGGLAPRVGQTAPRPVRTTAAGQTYSMSAAAVQERQGRPFSAGEISDRFWAFYLPASCALATLRAPTLECQRGG